ncbi:MAG TPA: efflux RND transporter permease subunit, partial [Candidatus Latescibacteria bacterium]|nr:efflux RND transporter permease subunit [Candidatus Latescibacterota bacterium]
MNPLHGFIRVALRNTYLVLVAALLVVVIGVVALSGIPSDLLPVFDTPAVQIVTFYPGMPAEVMERDIMSRLERWTGQSVGIEHQEARAMLGVCIVKDFFREGISLDTAMSQVTSYAMSDMFYLPPGTIPPMVMPFDPTAMTPLCLVSVSSNDPAMTEKDLYDIAYYQLRNRLQSIQGVIAPAVYGGKLRRILAYVDRDKLHSRGLDPLDVVDAIGKWNTLIPTGNAKLGELDFQLSANGMVKDVRELDDVPIKFKDGRPIYLRDVGNVEDSSQIQTNIVRINGRRQVYIPIYRQPGENSLAIVQSIKDLIEPIEARLSQPVNLGVVFDQSTVIKSAINELSLAAIIGAVFAALVIVGFLRSLLPSVAVLVTVPLAVLGTFIGLSFSSQTINVMTLGGIALAVGVMVDQAVVIMENILRHLRGGKTPLAAAWDGAREVATPVLVSTLTFIAVFFPVVFLTGMAKFLFAPLAVTVIFAMIFSYIMAMLIIPAFAAAFLRAESAEGKSPAAAPAAPPIPPGFEDGSTDGPAGTASAPVGDEPASRGGGMQSWYEGLVRKFTRRPW